MWHAATIRLWDTATRDEICRFDGRAAAVYSVAFSRARGMVACGMDNATCLIWSPRR